MRPARSMRTAISATRCWATSSPRWRASRSRSMCSGRFLSRWGCTTAPFCGGRWTPALATTPHFGAPLAVLPGAYPYNRAHAPSSTLHSSAADMCRWMLANLAQGTLDGRRFVSEAGHAALWHPEVVTGEEGWDEVKCLGWSRGTYRGHGVVHHSGSDPGYYADLVLLPHLQAGVVVMANAYCPAAWGIADAALDLLLGLAPALPRKPITVPRGAGPAGWRCGGGRGGVPAAGGRGGGRVCLWGEVPADGHLGGGRAASSRGGDAAAGGVGSAVS